MILGLKGKPLSPKKLFNLFARAEAVTWTLLIIALVARALNVEPLVVTVAGGIHGAVFLCYAVTAVLVGINQRWNKTRTSLAVSLAIIPFATVPFEIRLNKSDALDGSWRTQESDNPKDKHWFDKLFRFFIARPALLIVTLALGLTFVFSFLLFLGPPTEWFR